MENFRWEKTIYSLQSQTNVEQQYESFARVGIWFLQLWLKRFNVLASLNWQIICWPTHYFLAIGQKLFQNQTVNLAQAQNVADMMMKIFPRLPIGRERLRSSWKYRFCQACIRHELHTTVLAKLVFVQKEFKIRRVTKSNNFYVISTWSFYNFYVLLNVIWL